MVSFPSAAALALGASMSLVPPAARADCGGGPAPSADLGPACAASLPFPPASVLGRSSGTSLPSHAVEVGDVVPRGRYSIILNADYYGLPPVSDGWVYMRIGGDAFRVDWRTHQVLERVTDRVAANF